MRLTLEIPLPIPNVLALDIGCDLEIPTRRREEERSEKSGRSGIGIQRLAMLGCELPTVPFSTLPLFSMFGVDTVTGLWGHALLGEKILLVSSQLNALTIVAETIVSLLYPMKWTGAYVPVLPYPALTLVHAPMSWILGVEITNRDSKAGISSSG